MTEEEAHERAENAALAVANTRIRTERHDRAREHARLHNIAHAPADHRAFWLDGRRVVEFKADELPPSAIEKVRLALAFERLRIMVSEDHADLADVQKRIVVFGDELCSSLEVMRDCMLDRRHDLALNLAVSIGFGVQLLIDVEQIGKTA